MPKDGERAEQGKRKRFTRRVESETVRINGVPVKFFRRKGKWHWQSIGGRIRRRS